MEADAPARTDRSSRPRMVAVIGVHGVGYHAPGASGRAMANLLLGLAGDGGQPATHRYSAFESQTIQVPLQPIEVASLPQARPSFFGFMQEPSAAFGADLHARRRTAVAPKRGRVGNDFMRLLLAGYPGGAAGGTYVTDRLIARRNAADPGGAAEVHVYEAYWADLARPKNTLLSFFFAVFQLLLHLGSLSRLALESGAAERSGRPWRMLTKAQEYAVRTLQLPIPLLNVILLIAGLSILALRVPDDWLWLVVHFLAGAVGVVVSLSVRTVPRGPTGWALRPLAWFIGGAVIAEVVLRGGAQPFIVLAVEWWIAGAVLMRLVINGYDSVREGVREIGWLLYALAVAAFIVLATLATKTADSPRGTLGTGVLWTVEWLLASLRFFWLMLFACAITAAIFGSLAWRSIRDPAPRARARAAVRTSRLALALPALLMMLIIIFLWGGLFRWTTKAFSPRLFGDVRVTLAPGANQPGLRMLFFDPKDIPAQVPGATATRREITIDNYFASILVWTVGPGLIGTLVIAALALFLLVWWVVPAIKTERLPSRAKAIPPRSSTNLESLRLGQWLSRGIDATAVVTVLLWWAIFIVPLAAGIIAAVSPVRVSAMNLWTDGLIRWSSALTASLALLGLIVRYSSSALGIVLDVDNYLRALPRDGTPRAQIVERYISLLRYVGAYRDANGRGYSSLVIVAHSLGALISADLLHFLHATRDRSLEPLGFGREKQAAIPIALFTMGNPLRQLLDRFFPYLYDWVRASPDNSLGPLPTSFNSTPPVIAPDALPRPGDLGVCRWVNAYRSGDYVGRELWLNEWYCRNKLGADQGRSPQPPYIATQAALTPSTRAELCIGAGAHQHYWDDSAPDVAQLLDALIVSEAGAKDLLMASPASHG